MKVQFVTLYLFIVFLFWIIPIYGKDIRVEDVALAELRNLGKCLGVDRGSGEIRALGIYRMPLGTFGDSAGAILIRDRGYKIASLEARKQILQYLKTSMSAQREYDFHSSYDNSGVNDVKSLVQAFSERVLCGWRVEVSVEAHETENYAVAVVVSWSAAREQKFLEMKDGKLCPAKHWKGELLEYVKNQDLSSWADVRIYIDSLGYPHLLGIGVFEWDGTVQVKSIAMKKAEMFALKNLLHGLYGDSKVNEVAIDLSKENFSRSEKVENRKKVYNSLLDIQYNGEKPEGINAIYTGKIKVMQNEAIIMIYSYEPPLKRDFIENTYESKQKEELKKNCNTNPVKVFNPSTGKFE